MFRRAFLLPTLSLILLALFAGVPAAQGAMVLYLDIDNKEMSLFGVGPFTDLAGDTDFPDRIRLRTAGSTTGLFYSQNLPDDFARVGGLGNVERNGPVQSSVQVRSNGRVLDLQLAFPNSLVTDGFFTGGITHDYSGSINFVNAIGDGSGLTSRTLTAYMPDPESTFPFDPSFEIAIVTELPAIPEPVTVYGIISALGLFGLVGYRRFMWGKNRR